MKNIRLKPFEIEAICTAFRAHFPPEDHLWLFGSRANPQARGGDIDLYIKTTIQDVGVAVDKKMAFAIEIEDRIGEQKIDVVLKFVTSDYKLAIYEVAREEGVQLV